MLSFRHHHTHLTGQDPQKTVDFYTQVMGAKITGTSQVRNMKNVDVDLGGINVRISGSTGADEKWKGLRYGLHHVGLAVNSMDELTAQLKSKGKQFGAEYIVEPFASSSGGKVAFLKGPDNVLFEIVELNQDK
jgi:catechol 2,3-dioxygenase-like lactoylglutathione lyase family enzyme